MKWGYPKLSKNSEAMKEQTICIRFVALVLWQSLPLNCLERCPASFLAVASVWKWVSSMNSVSNREQLENEKKRRETIEREKEQMLREKEELLVRLQEYEVKTQKAEKGKVLVVTDETMCIVLHRRVICVPAYTYPKSDDTGISWQGILISAYVDKYRREHALLRSSKAWK